MSVPALFRQIARASHESKGLTPMADAKGRGARSTKKSLPSGEHFPALRARSSTTAFRDNSTPVPKQRGGPPSLVRVSGIDHTGPVQGRTEGNRSLAKTTDGPEPSTADRARVPLFDWLNVGGVGDARGPVMGSGGPIEGPSQVSSYTRVPATSFRSVLTHINTRSVCTLGRHPPSPAVFVSSHFFPSLATLFFRFRPLLLILLALLGRCSAAASSVSSSYLSARPLRSMPGRPFGCSFFDLTARFCCLSSRSSLGYSSVTENRAFQQRLLTDELNGSLPYEISGT